jgi:hypothetical protein
MSNSIVFPSAFSTSKITFSAVKSLDSGGKQAYLNYSGNPLMMQVGPLETPFGLSVYDKGGPPKYSVDLKLRGYDDPVNYAKNATLFTALSALDEFMLEQAEKNAVAWFKGPKSRAVLSELYTPTVRFALDKEGNRKPYPPTIKATLRKQRGSEEFDVELYDDKLQPLKNIPMEDVVVKGSVLTVLIQCTGVWFAGAKFGLSWKATQIRADKIPQNFRGKPAFLDEDGEPATASAGAGTSTAQSKAFAALHDDENDEEVDDEEALAVPAAKAPAAAPAPEDEGDDEAPLPVPAKKTTFTAKSIKKVVKPAAK